MSKEWLFVILGGTVSTVVPILYFWDAIMSLVSNYRTWSNRMQGSRAHQDPHYDLPPKTNENSTSISYLEKNK